MKNDLAVRRAPLGWLHQTLIAATLLLVTLLIGVQLARADEPSHGSTADIPSTAAYFLSSHPMISGEVITVNDHQMVVNTDQGEQVLLEIDWRTMAPRDLRPGMTMRAEFLALPNCRLYAQRIYPMRDGAASNRLQAYANTQDSPESVAQNSYGLGDPNRIVRTGYTHAESRASSGQTMSWHSPGRNVEATPSTADYGFSTHPFISGTVLAVNDHRLVIETAQGQKLPMVMDSRTMLPREIAPGSVLHAEFSQLSDGRYYAKRITRTGARDADREQAYAHTHDNDIQLASTMPDCATIMVEAPGSTSSIIDRGESSVDLASREPVRRRPARLPRTASDQPWILLSGVLSVGCAAVFAAMRRRRDA